MGEFKVGQKVHVEFDGTVVYENSAGSYDIEFDADVRSVEYVPARFVTKAAAWPPQIGDIWEADGNEYFVRESRQLSGDLFISSCSTEADDYFNRDLDQFKGLNPQLLRRRGQ